MANPITDPNDPRLSNPAMANLRRLALNVGTDIDEFDDSPGYLGDDEIRAICYSPHLTGLKELALHSINVTRDDAWRSLFKI